MRKKIEQLQQQLAGGVSPAMATPLQSDGYDLNLPRIKSLVDFLIGAGVKGLFVGGTTGEGVLLAQTQRTQLHEEALDAVGGRVPVLLHVGANTTAEAVALARHAAVVGADAIVAVTPYFYPIHDDALLAYFEQVAAAAPELPFFVYDLPHMAVNGIGPELLQRLAEAIPTLAGIKCSRPDAQMIRRLLDAAPAGICLLAGNEAIALASLALGAEGLISGLSTAVPEPFVALTQAVADGDLDRARAQQRLINRLLALIPSGTRIGAIKQILQQRGIDVGPAVPPRPGADVPDLWETMKARGALAG